MDANIIDAIVNLLIVYTALGGIFAVYFVVWGATTMDPGHEHSAVQARLVLVPGVIALWPYLVLRMLAGAKFEG